MTKAGISKGAVISILKDAREGKFPGLELRDSIDELRNLSVRLRKEGMDLGQARFGFGFLKRLLDTGIEPERVEEWINFCSELSPSPPDGFPPAAMELLNIEKQTGKSYAEIGLELKELSSQREKLINEVEDLQAKEMRAREFKDEIEKNSKEIGRLSAEKSELEALRQGQEKLSSQLEKASSDFKNDLKLIGETRDELARLAELKGRYQKAVENLE